MKTKALVVLSGGQDSTTCLFWARDRFDEVHAVTFDYNQRHSRELDAARIVAQRAEVLSHDIVTLGPILHGRSPLTNPDEELEQYKDFTTMDSIIGNRVELTFVPMRNALFLTIAANRAVCGEIYDVVTGVCQADNANYPDCKQEFIDSMQTMINRALGLDYGKFRIHTPLMNLSKSESIKVAADIPGAYAALAWTHTAYDGAYPPTGRDHATILRAHGFEESGLPDPLVLRAVRDGLMKKPNTVNYSDEAIARHDKIVSGKV